MIGSILRATGVVHPALPVFVKDHHSHDRYDDKNRKDNPEDEVLMGFAGLSSYRTTFGDVAVLLGVHAVLMLSTRLPIARCIHVGG